MYEVTLFAYGREALQNSSRVSLSCVTTRAEYFYIYGYHDTFIKLYQIIFVVNV